MLLCGTIRALIAAGPWPFFMQKNYLINDHGSLQAIFSHMNFTGNVCQDKKVQQRYYIHFTITCTVGSYT